jgi:hypothetical protein
MIRTPVAPPKLLRFAEKVNGRCAMQGVTWGATNFAYTHHSITQQMSDPKSVLAAVSVAGAVTLGTAITAGILDNDVPETKPDSFWNAEAELINSRVAMAAFPVLAIATSFYSS